MFQFVNVGAETVGKFEVDFINAANVKAVQDSNSLSFSLHPGEHKEQLFVFEVRASKNLSHFLPFLVPFSSNGGLNVYTFLFTILSRHPL